MVQIKFKRISKDAILPKYQTPGSAGFDIHASEDVTIKPGECLGVPTGWEVSFPYGYELQIRSRSSMALMGVNVPTSPGVIDFDYTDELKILLHNYGNNDYTVRRGDRIAQGVLEPILKAQIIESDFERTTERKGGFGSTGK